MLQYDIFELLVQAYSMQIRAFEFLFGRGAAIHSIGGDWIAAIGARSLEFIQRIPCINSQLTIFTRLVAIFIRIRRRPI